ncbi:MAG TPA: HEAT repeat domain-containing protein [Terriglobia bacterium]|nr:HEAT repeat domain-containing protein [Terriglobia bacterium]
MTAKNIADFFAETLTGNYEDDAPWEAVQALRRIGSREVFTSAAEWCKSSDPLRRARIIDILAQLGKTVDHPTNSFPDESYSIVSNLVEHERELQPLASAIAALGHLDNPLAIPLMIEHRTHPSPEIRYQVACALGSFPNDPRSASTFLVLMADADGDVRDWATFGLGSLCDSDSPEIRNAFIGRLADSNEDVREEAIAGLGKRRDHRAVSPLLAVLEQTPVTDRIIEAASQLLDMEYGRKGWGPPEYAAALRERFRS